MPFRKQPGILCGALCLAALSACLTVSGCAGDEKQVSFKSGGMTHTFAEGKNAVPGDFPLPVYPDAKPTGSVSAAGDNHGDEAQFLMLSTGDPVEKVIEFYQKELKARGWEVEKVQNLPLLTSIAARRAEFEGNIMVSADGDKTTVSLSVGKSSAGDNPDASPDTSVEYTPDNLTPPTD